MKKIQKTRKYFPVLTMFLSVLFSMFSVEAQVPDQNLVARYGLKIPQGDIKSGDFPGWLKKADMVTNNYDVWKDHKFILKDTLVTHIVRVRAGNEPKVITENYPVETIGSFDGSLVKGVPLISHVPHSKKAFVEAHKQGFKVVPYVHFMCIYTNFADQDVFLFEHPEILLKDAKGKWVHTPMDGSDRVYRLLTCSNSPSYWKLSLDYVKKLMDWGADGVFIDNVGRNREPCYAPKFRTNNPEFGPYVHEHLFPDTSTTYAWGKMLLAIRTLVKSYGEDKIVFLNSGIGSPYQLTGDCCMWESFIYSWAWEGRRNSWPEIKKRAADNEWYYNAGGRIVAFSYLNNTRKEIKEDAFWAFSAARLAGFIWMATLNGSGAEILYNTHMGEPVSELREDNGIAYRIFRNGIIVLNDTPSDRDIGITLPRDIKAREMADVFTNSSPIRLRSGKLSVTVPGKTARVYAILKGS